MLSQMKCIGQGIGSWTAIVQAGVETPLAGELATFEALTAGLLSLPMLLLLFSLLWLFDVPCSLSEPKALLLGVRQVGSSQTLPVNDLTRKPVLSHFLHGLPVRSRARSPALMIP